MAIALNASMTVPSELKAERLLRLSTDDLVNGNRVGIVPSELKAERLLRQGEVFHRNLRGGEKFQVNLKPKGY